MTQNSKIKEGIPAQVIRTLHKLGENISIARTRRGWTLDQMAGSMPVTRKTLSRLEKGDPGAIVTYGIIPKSPM